MTAAMAAVSAFNGTCHRCQPPFGNPQLLGSRSARSVLRCKIGLSPPGRSCGVSSKVSAGVMRISQRRRESVGGTVLRVPIVSKQQKQFSLSNPVSAFAEAGGGVKNAGHRTIWWSDVVVTRTRPYFLNRRWTSKDLSYATYMIFMHALCVAAPFTFSWGAFGVFVILYFITGCLGITLSFHRNLAHKSFKLPKWLEYAFAYCGVQAVQGDPIEWVSSHRYHHQHCDTDKDPHTPLEGFWHSHMGWLLDDQTTDSRVGARANIGDMEKDPFYKFIQKTYIWHPILMAASLYGLGGVPFVIWGMAVRAVWVYHITWFVNSASHVWGFQSWKTGDLSRNNWWVALLAFGEGWHNNHHAFEYSARHGLEWWQLDPTWYVVKLLEVVGLATKVKLPTMEHKRKLAFATT